MDSARKGQGFKRGCRKRDKGYYVEVVMKIRIISWNVRGVNDAEKWKLKIFFLKTQKVDLVYI